MMKEDEYLKRVVALLRQDPRHWRPLDIPPNDVAQAYRTLHDSLLPTRWRHLASKWRWRNYTLN